MNGGGISRSYQDQDVGGLDVHVLDLRQVDECGSSAETREKLCMTSLNCWMGISMVSALQGMSFIN